MAGFNEGRSVPGGFGVSGSSGSVQFKQGATFGGDNEFHYNPDTDTLTITGTVSASAFLGDGSGLTGIGGGGSGDVTGPGSSTDNAIARFDTATGKIIQNSGITIDDSNNMDGVASLDMSAMSTGYFEVGVGGVPLQLYDGTPNGILNINNGEMDWDGNLDLGADANSYHKVSGTISISGSEPLKVFGPTGVGVGGPAIVARNTASFGSDWQQPMSGAFIVSDNVSGDEAVMYVHSQGTVAAIGFKNSETLAPLIGNLQSNYIFAASRRGVWLGLQGDILQLQNNIGDTIIRADGSNEIVVSGDGTKFGDNATDYHQVSGTLDVSGSVKALGFAPNRVAYASTTTITDVTAIAGVTSGGITLTLPAVSTFSGSTLIVKDESGTVSGSNTVIISCSSGVTIDGATTATIASPYGAITTYHNGTNWFIY